MTSETSDLRLTPQRRAVLDVLRAAPDHPTAAEVIQRVREISPGIGPATVYRALGRLVETGQASELALGDGAARYDANTTRHDHLVCDGCGRAVDVDVPVPRELTHRLATETQFEITSYDLKFHGLCPTCQTHQ
jgi:Fur family ferric uptake transcriptional regulator/Fur family peroxide stress response transcriptional regulator